MCLPWIRAVRLAGLCVLALPLGWAFAGCQPNPPPPPIVRLAPAAEPEPPNLPVIVPPGRLTPGVVGLAACDFDTAQVGMLEIAARGTAERLVLKWMLEGEKRFRPHRQFTLPLRTALDQLETYRIDLQGESGWLGRVTRLGFEIEEGELEVTSLGARPPDRGLRSVALAGTAIPSLAGSEAIELEVPADLRGVASFQVHLGLLPEFDHAGVEARFRVMLDRGSGYQTVLDETLEGGAGLGWQSARVRLQLARGSRLRMGNEVRRAGAPLPPAAAVWGGPALYPERFRSDPKLPDNLIVVVIDTLRTDLLGSYGASPSPTPHLDRLARRSIRFERFYAPAPWTLPSVASLLTGLHPQTHGAGLVNERLAPSAIHPGVQTLAEALSAHGLSSIAVYDNIYLSPSFGLHRGFDFYASMEDARAQAIVDRAVELIDGLEQRPFFLFLHLFDPHNPYSPPAADCARALLELPENLRKRGCHGDRRPGLAIPAATERPWFEALYRAEVAYTDSALGSFFEALEQRSLLDQSVVLVVGDHGEEFWHRLDQEQALGYRIDGDHGHTHYEELIHVPALLAGPQLEPRVVRHPMQMADPFATLLALMGTEPEQPVQGFDLLHLLGGAPATPRLLISDFILHGEQRRAAREGWWKLVTSPSDQSKTELYDLRRDPEETLNVAAEHADVVARLRRRTQQELEARAATRRSLLGEQAVSETFLTWKQIIKLRTLGYLE